MSNEEIGSVAILTSGGDSPGMNAAIRAVVRAGHYYGFEVYGVERGYRGLIEGQLRAMSSRDVSGIINRGGTALRSARCKEFREPEGRARAAETLRAHGIGAVIAIGGDGTYRGAHALHQEHGTRVIGIPGTIDNDIGGTDFTIGYDTALNTALDAIDRLRDTARSHDRIFFVEVMGRSSGYLAMTSAIAGGSEEVLVPEIESGVDDLIAAIRACRDKGKKSNIVVVAEGDELGDAATIARAVAERSEFKDARVTVIGHLQRGGSPTAFDRILASRLGVAAIEALLEGRLEAMMAINGNQVVARPLSDAWNLKTTFDATYPHIAHILAT